MNKKIYNINNYLKETDVSIGKTVLVRTVAKLVCAGCGRKRSGPPGPPGPMPFPMARSLRSEDPMATLLDLNSEPAVAELSRQILSEAKLWEAIQEARDEVGRRQQMQQLQQHKLEVGMPSRQHVAVDEPLHDLVVARVEDGVLVVQLDDGLAPVNVAVMVELVRVLEQGVHDLAGRQRERIL